MKVFSRLLASLLLTAVLSSCGAPMLHQTSAEGLTFTLYGKNRVEKIEVTRDKDSIGTYREKGVTLDMLTQLEDSTYGLRVTDLNFDSKPDMQLMVANTKSGPRFVTWLWDESKGEYVRHTRLSSLNDVGAIASLEVITAREYEYTVDPATSDTPEFYIEKNNFVLYRWIDGALTEVHRKELTYYEESDIYCYAIYEREEDGSMELTRESWINEESFDPDQYPLDATGYAA